MRAFLVSISIVVATFATLTLYARAQGVAEGRAQVAELYDAGPVDPVVAADHAIRPVAAPVDPPPAAKPGPSLVDRALRIASKPTWVALGFALMVGMARLLAFIRAKKQWARRGWVGYLSGGVVACLGAAGVAGAVSGSTDAAGLAMAGALITAFGYARDPETARTAKGPGEEVPT